MMNSVTVLNKSSDASANTGIDITFRNISYTVDAPVRETIGTPCLRKTTKKLLLNNISGIFKAGEATAIMGASGAGKTTLLNILACRVPLQNQQGEIKANSFAYQYEHFGDFANYVMQNDLFMQTLTVRETLRFAADLKLNASDTEKVEAIDRLTKNLKLQNCLDTLVGGALIKGISGGEKKRTSIAYELISDPQVIMLDEPTSGLDSLTSYIIVKYLSDLAKDKTKTIIMTIHQPNSEIFYLFDKLILMVQGNLIYQGPADTAADYFSTEFNLTCPLLANPADFFMSIMHCEQKDNVERYQNYYTTYQNRFGKAIKDQIQNCNSEKFEKRQVNVGWSTTYCALLGRDIKNILRNPMLIRSRIFQTVVLALYMGGIYCKFGSDYKDPITWHALTGFFFFLCINSVFIALIPVALTFPLQRDVFMKEQSAKLYGVTAYFMSKNTVQLPYSLIFPVLQSLILYWFVGLSSTAGQYFTFYLILLLGNLCGMSLGLLSGSIAKDTRAASGNALLILMPLIIFSGYFKNQGNLPSWVGWIQYISPFKYGFVALTRNQVLFKSSNISLMNFDVGLWGSIGILAALGITARLLSWFFLWKMRGKLE